MHVSKEEDSLQCDLVLRLDHKIRSILENKMVDFENNPHLSLSRRRRIMVEAIRGGGGGLAEGPAGQTCSSSSSNLS